MKDPNKTDDYFVKLGGKANIPSPLVIGHNYELKAQGTVTAFTESDKNDGSHVVYYKFEPVLIEVINDKGEAIRAKDTRSMSQLFRARMWRQWQNAKTDMSFDDWYARLMTRLIQDADTVAEMYGDDARNI